MTKPPTGPFAASFSGLGPAKYPPLGPARCWTGTTLFPPPAKHSGCVELDNFPGTKLNCTTHLFLAHAHTPLTTASMDSPIVTQLFRQLFRQRPRGCQGHWPATTTTLRNRALGHDDRRSLRPSSYHGRQYATRASLDRGMKKNESRWQQRSHLLPEDRSDEFARYPYISMQELKQRTERPRKVKMLLRDFIEGRVACPIAKHAKLETDLLTPNYRRLPLQPLLRLLFQAGRDLQPRRAVRLQRDARRD